MTVQRRIPLAKALSDVDTRQREISEYIDRNKDRFVEKLRILCQQPSVSAQNLGMTEAAKLVERFLKETGFTTESFSPTHGPPIIFGELTSKRGSRTLLVYNHYDVQPVEPVDLWTHPPFSAAVEDGRIYARGASDNKGNIVSRLMAIDACQKAGGDGPCNIKWVIQDEDGRILIEGWYDDVKPFTPEELEVIRSMPLEEHSIRDELGIKSFLYGLTGFEFKKAFYGNPTANIAGIWSGYTGPGHKTVLPSVARAKMDFRLVPDQDPARLAGKLKQHLARHGFEDIEVSLQAENPAARTPISSPIAKMAARAGKEVFHKEPVTLVTSAASGPMHYFTNTLRLPTVAIGCNHPRSNTHAPDENQRIDVFVQGAKWIAMVIEDFAKSLE